MHTFNKEKFRELVLHITIRCELHPLSGKTDLYKTLFCSEFEAYRRTKKSITGARYLAEEDGPVPELDAQNLIALRMVKDGDLALKQMARVRRYVALRDPDYSLFTAEEIVAADDAIDICRNAISAVTGARSYVESLAWQAALAEHKATGRQVVIPYGAALVNNPVLDQFEEAHALELARKHHWPA